VQVSLARTGRWIRDLGRVAGGLAIPGPTEDGVVDLLETTDAPGLGRVHAVCHAAELGETPARWDRPPVNLGTDLPTWL
jgi:hypothetical protein